jgi:GxxExxY protein
VLELKAVPAIERLHVAQVRAYLRASGCRLGFVLNFGAPTLGIRRVVL